MSARLRAVAPLADRSRSVVLCGDVRRSGLVCGSVLGHQGLEEKKGAEWKKKKKSCPVSCIRFPAEGSVSISITIVSERI